MSAMIAEIAKVSSDCEQKYEYRAAADAALLSFPKVLLQLDPSKRVSSFNCKIFWKYEAPKGKRLKAAKLWISGKLQAAGASEALLRASHKLLGLGDMPEIKKFEIKDGVFKVEMDLQNISAGACDQETKLISQVHMILKSPSALKENASKPELSLQEIGLSALEFENCSQRTDFPQ